MCVYIHTYIHTYIYIYIYTGWGPGSPSPPTARRRRWGDFSTSSVAGGYAAPLLLHDDSSLASQELALSP